MTCFLTSFQPRRLCRSSLTSKVGFACQCLPLTNLNSIYIFQRSGLGNLHQLTTHLLLYSLFSISFLNIWSLSFPCPPPLFSMHFLPSLLASSLSLIISGVSAASHESHLGKRCTNSASDRSCWGDYDLSTDYYNTVPDTGVTREVIFPYFLHENILTVSSTTSNLSTQQLHPMESREMSCLSMEHFLALLSSPTGETLLVSISTPFFPWSY